MTGGQQRTLTHLDNAVEGGRGEGVVVLGIDDDLHHVVGVALEHLLAAPLLVPVPQFDRHVICQHTTGIREWSELANPALSISCIHCTIFSLSLVSSISQSHSGFTISVSSISHSH